ncbi:hypothetical protein CULC809_01401 [Corynebacterium ulcerans 809]|uniref:LapA family protein n=1 Tax=Corynebacterium ulcerans TaxID=65058 RepID=UPI000218512C|nr:lipopolysaccharide assembly protein LapA domain-containing protein [Corynebacterium ulcerans]AEG81933.1 hypothetical protein CULC809_01401 [Corynebacterium ulcerans 809]
MRNKDAFHDSSSPEPGSDMPFPSVASGSSNESDEALRTSTELSVPTQDTIGNSSAPASKQTVKKTFAGGTWVALIIGALLLILLLIFILQNQEKVALHMFVWEFSVPVGVGFLLASITGALIMALVGGVRMFQLRRQITKHQ